MSKKTGCSQQSSSKLHLRYIRLPDRVMDLHTKLIYRSESVIVDKSQIASANSVTFDGEIVLALGFQITYFMLMRKWFGVGKIRDVHGRHTGYYCDIVTPPRLLEDGGVELTDLFLDLWVSPDLRYRVLDREELENALRKGWITKKLYKRAKKELDKLIDLVKKGGFPPRRVKQLEKKLDL
jgi:predicted RNA-binding protein associated with RNAse of E/G family